MTLALEQKSALTALEAPGKQELKSEFIELRAKGWSYIRIASRLKVSKSTLSNWRAELENEIASLKAMELEALYEEYFLVKEGRIKKGEKMLLDAFGGGLTWGAVVIEW